MVEMAIPWVASAWHLGCPVAVPHPHIGRILPKKYGNSSHRTTLGRRHPRKIREASPSLTGGYPRYTHAPYRGLGPAHLEVDLRKEADHMRRFTENFKKRKNIQAAEIMLLTFRHLDRFMCIDILVHVNTHVHGCKLFSSCSAMRPNRQALQCSLTCSSSMGKERLILHWLCVKDLFPADLFPARATCRTAPVQRNGSSSASPFQVQVPHPNASKMQVRSLRPPGCALPEGSSSVNSFGH